MALSSFFNNGVTAYVRFYDLGLEEDKHALVEFEKNLNKYGMVRSDDCVS